MHLLGECSEPWLIRIWATLAQFWPSSGKNDLKWVKMVVSDYYLKKSIDTTQCKLDVYTHWVSVQN